MIPFKNILVVRTDRMGDVVLTIPSIRALKKQFPGAKVSVWLDASTRPLMGGLSFIDDLIVEDKERGWQGFFALVALLRRKRFDLAVIYHTKRRTNAACALAGIPMRLGYKNNKNGWMLTHPVEDRRHIGEKHEVMYCLDLLRPIGVESTDISLELPHDKAAELWANDMVHSILEDQPFWYFIPMPVVPHAAGRQPLM
ncbi:MAG: glycosyltransferase family 9 protein [Candidatus Omnitrophota bacterium]